MKKGYIGNIEEETLANENFRKVLYTSNYSQLVVMSIKSGEEIGEEVHGLDQFIRFEKGKGQVLLDGVVHEVEDDFAVVIPAGTLHNVLNTGEEVMKLYTVYSPPEHKDGVVHTDKATAEADGEDHFDGNTTE